jgi:predicted DCC family thiol-disulfide oxidoreductase YuxK
MEERIIVFYDGACGFCNRVVQFIFKYEKWNTIYFAPLNSDFAKEFLSQNLKKIDPNTFYLYDGKSVFSKSTAALKLLAFLKWYWLFLRVFWIIPKFIRDWGYEQIAKRRHVLATQACFLPDDEQRKRFLA